ncbi:hypothetical protein RHMOL_Rhmol08G0023700 [Rhododendron molle]|uniref:Uncharacterized protein n=1 Tax=Rhododendron molle TaxID=49168 RepID=A0ACC0MKR2_RHOML|nr:hypothetical protein RHMOL_Rhmol08G0023700 [Rhododendron molle]
MCASKVLERDSKANIFKGPSAEKGYPHRVTPFSENLNEFSDLSSYFKVKHWLQATETKILSMKAILQKNFLSVYIFPRFPKLSLRCTIAGARESQAPPCPPHHAYQGLKHRVH